MPRGVRFDSLTSIRVVIGKLLRGVINFGIWIERLADMCERKTGSGICATNELSSLTTAARK